MAIQYRAIQGTQAQEQFSGLLDRSFPVLTGTRFFDDFPVWDEKFGAITHKVGGFSNNELVCSSGVRLAKLKTPSAQLLVGIIGAVATDEKWRGKGLASEAVSHAIQWAQEKGATMLLLWGSEHALYSRLGFELTGIQVQVPISQLSLDPKTDSDSIRSGWNHELFQHLRKRSHGLALEPTDEIWFSEHKNVKWLWTKDFQAYLAYGRGIDLQGIVHEWGGENNALLRLLSTIHKENPEAKLLAPPLLLDQYGFSFDENTAEYLCMVRILEPDKIFSAYWPGTAFSAQKESPQNKQGGWRVTIEKQVFSSLTEGELVRFFFGPEQLFKLNTQRLPVPFWIWGLDAA